MSVTRKVKFEYYEVVSKYKCDQGNDRDRSFDLRRLISIAENLSLEGRTFDYYQEQARLDRFWYDEKIGYWFLNLARLRATNIPSKASETTELEPIELSDDEYIGEDVTALYDEKINVLMLQRNRHSLSPEGIEKYFNLLWNDDSEEIYLRPIYLENPIDNVKKSKYYRKFSIRFADLPKFNENNWKGKSSFKKLIKAFGEYDAVNAEIIINVGMKRDATLERETVHEVLDEICDNRDIISKAELSKKDTDDTNVEVIDLFEHNIHDYLYFVLEERKSLESEQIAYRMYEKYIEKRKIVMDSIKEKES